MKYSTSNPIELQKAKTYFDYLISKGLDIEIKKVAVKRTSKQNAYLHVCITLWGIHVGYSIEEAKTHLKRACGWMSYKKNNEKFLKLTRNMDPKELTDFIDWIRNYSSKECGYYIPTSEEYYENKFYFDRQIEEVKEFL